MKRILILIALAPVALALLLFAIANRQFVSVSLDPFANDTPAIAFTAPLFIVLLVSGMVGVMVGGFASWVTQGKHRRAARMARSDAAQARSEVDALKGRLAAVSPVQARALIGRDAA